MVKQEELDAAAEVAVKIKELIDKGEQINTDELGSLLDTLFFDTFNHIPLSHIYASEALNKVGVINEVGEGDSFGPLSWKVFLPHNQEWFIFG